MKIENSITRDVHRALIAWAEPEPDRKAWRKVKLADADHGTISEAEFRAHLRQLSRLGLYARLYRGYGLVRPMP